MRLAATHKNNMETEVTIELPLLLIITPWIYALIVL